MQATANVSMSDLVKNLGWSEIRVHNVLVSGRGFHGCSCHGNKSAFAERESNAFVLSVLFLWTGPFSTRGDGLG